MERASDIEFLTARLHGRRSRLAEAERLDDLCCFSALSEFYAAAHPGSELHSNIEFQQQLVNSLCLEISEFTRHLAGAAVRLVDWILVRFQLENVKLLLRGYLNSAPPEQIAAHLVLLPKRLAFDPLALGRAGSIEQFIAMLPNEGFRKSAERALKTYHDQPLTFFLESALDAHYFQELLRRVGSVPGEDRDLIRALANQEIDGFHVMLVVRGRVHFSIKSELLPPFHVDGTRISLARFDTMLAAPDLRTMAQLAAGRALDVSPSDLESMASSGNLNAAYLEALCRNRFLRLSNQAFRQSHMGLGAVVGYVGIRRMEIANLITISEGVRLRVPAESIRERLVSRFHRGPAYV